MAVTVILPRSLVSLIPGTIRRSEVEASTVAEAITALDVRTPGLRNRLVDSGPVIREHINVFVDGTQADLDTPLRDGATIHVIPAVSGGAGRVVRYFSASAADPAKAAGVRWTNRSAR